MKKTVAIIGSGPAALMLGAELNNQKFDVSIYDRNPAPGRKFLVAGEGGFNLTHSEEIPTFISRYTPSSFFEPLISSFSNTDLQKWFASMGIPTFIGSSKRIFPEKGIKPIEVLEAILNLLKKKNVAFKTEYNWKGWNDANEMLFELNDQTTASVKADIVVFALGGASWKATGSDGLWTTFFSEKEIEIIPFQASNCAYQINWKNEFIEFAAGQPLKNISLKCDGNEKKGEVVITQFGLEGGAIYALSPQIRKQLNEQKKTIIFLDLKPLLSVNDIKRKISDKGNKSLSRQLETALKINKVQLALLKNVLSKDEFVNPETLSAKIKDLPLIISGTAPLDDAISTVGGISLNEIDENFQLKKLPLHYTIGEMLDWDAPTGGYLLQACFSMGNVLAKKLNLDLP